MYLQWNILLTGTRKNIVYLAVSKCGILNIKFDLKLGLIYSEDVLKGGFWTIKTPTTCLLFEMKWAAGVCLIKLIRKEHSCLKIWFTDLREGEKQADVLWPSCPRGWIIWAEEQNPGLSSNLLRQTRAGLAQTTNAHTPECTPSRALTQMIWQEKAWHGLYVGSALKCHYPCTCASPHVPSQALPWQQPGDSFGHGGEDCGRPGSRRRSVQVLKLWRLSVRLIRQQWRLRRAARRRRRRRSVNRGTGCVSVVHELIFEHFGKGTMSKLCRSRCFTDGASSLHVSAGGRASRQNAVGRYLRRVAR